MLANNNLYSDCLGRRPGRPILATEVVTVERNGPTATGREWFCSKWPIWIAVAAHKAERIWPTHWSSPSLGPTWGRTGWGRWSRWAVGRFLGACPGWSGREYLSTWKFKYQPGASLIRNEMQNGCYGRLQPYHLHGYANRRGAIVTKKSFDWSKKGRLAGLTD